MSTKRYSSWSKKAKRWYLAMRKSNGGPSYGFNGRDRNLRLRDKRKLDRP